MQGPGALRMAQRLRLQVPDIVIISRRPKDQGRIGHLIDSLA